MPWFVHETVNDDIKLSVCGSGCNYCKNLTFGAYGTPIDLVELYIKRNNKENARLNVYVDRYFIFVKVIIQYVDDHFY